MFLYMIISLRGALKMKKIKIYNAKIITPYRIINNGTMIIDRGKILYVGEQNLSLDNVMEIDVMGNYVAPGFIDIHCHGGGGHDFMDGTVDAYLCTAKTHAQYGTTTLVPTTLTSSIEDLKKSIYAFNKAKAENVIGAELLGLHLEGPYFSMAQKGAQDGKYIKNPDFKEYNEILTWSKDIIRWSAAPELEGALEFGRYMRKKGILPSIAHTDSIYEHIQQAFENGFTHMTHLYSGMSGVKRIDCKRYAGVIESAFIIDEMTVEIIADGMHLPASILKLIYNIKGPSNIALITDSMRAAGMPEGKSILGSLKEGQQVIIEDGVAKLTDRSSFAGSVATSNKLVQTMIKKADVPLVDAVRMATSTPAKIIGIDKTKGSLSSDKDADIVVFNKDIDIRMVFIKGEIIYDKLENQLVINN